MIALLLLFVAIVPVYRNHLFFLNFVDEDDNIVIGSTLNHDNLLYGDIYSQHQPAQFVISALLQRTLTPDNILMNIKRHREAMIIWSVVWITLLTLRFGWPIYFVSVLLEFAKISFLGNLFLAESFVVYPLLYLLCYYFEQPVSKSKLEKWALTIIFFFIFFSLAPLWPLLLLYFALLLLRDHDKKGLLLRFLVVGAATTLIFAVFADARAYFYDVIWINYKYYIPLTAEFNTLGSVLRAFVAPVTILLSPNTTTLMLLLKTLSLSYLLTLYSLFAKKQYSILLIVISFVTLSNIRYVDPTNTLYGAFHLFPWFTTYVFFVVTYRPHFKLANYILILLSSIALINHSSKNLFDRRDLTHDYSVHYSTSEDLRQAVIILGRITPKTIWVEPVEYWPYWETGVKAYSHMVNYYGWMDQTPPLRDPLKSQFSNSLPDLVYSFGEHLGISSYLSRYTQLMRDNKPTPLYLRQDLLDSLTPEQLRDLNYYRFAFPKR